MIVDKPWFAKVVTLLSAGLMALWLGMIVVTVPHLTGITGGVAIFDQRVFGYSLEEARNLVILLGADGAAYYTGVQMKADSVFPLLQVMVVSGWLLIVARGLRKHGMAGLMTPTILGILAAMIGAIADYGENGAVRMMLEGGVEQLTADQVARASGMTQLKFAADTLAWLVLAGLVILRTLRRRPA